MNSKLIKLSKLSNDKLLTTLKKNKLDILKEIKKYLDDKYYNTGEDCEFTDEQYDILKEIIIDSDTYFKVTVGSKIREDNNRVKLPIWLGSLDKIKPEDENKLKNWLEKNNSDGYIIETKLDGVSCLIQSKDNKIYLYTRGDGEIGADISHLINYVKNIPKKIEKNIMIRGELIIKKEIFEEKYSLKFANSRNMISGLVNSKTLSDGLKDVEFIAYEVIQENEYQEDSIYQINKLDKLGFKTVKHNRVSKINMEILQNTLITYLEKSEYEIDGIICQSLKKYKRNIKDNPKYAFAFKMNKFIEAEVEGVEWNISKYKLLKPRIKIKPINLNGVTISYATGSNARIIVDKCIGKGAIVKLTRSGDVIPFISDVIKPSNRPELPENIPYMWNENNVEIIALEDEDNISEIKMISSFFSGMGIKNISTATVEKIYNNGFNSLIKILNAEAADFEKIDGFQSTLSKKIYDNIHNGLKDITLDNLLGSYNIFGEGLGKRKMKALLEGFPNILDINISNKDEIIQKIINIEGFSDKTAEKIYNNLEKAKKFLKDINKFISIKKEEKILNDEKKLEGLTVLFSGYRNKELENEIIYNGGKIATIVSKNLNILIVKDKDSSSSKIDKAKKLEIEILKEEEFLEIYLN